MKNIQNEKWWIAAGTRALKTVAQTAIATIGTAALMTEVNWVAVVSASALAGILSFLTSLAGLPEVEHEEATWTIKRRSKYRRTLRARK